MYPNSDRPITVVLPRSSALQKQLTLQVLPRAVENQKSPRNGRIKLLQKQKKRKEEKRRLLGFHPRKQKKTDVEDTLLPSIQQKDRIIYTAPQAARQDVSHLFRYCFTTRLHSKVHACQQLQHIVGASVMVLLETKS